MTVSIVCAFVAAAFTGTMITYADSLPPGGNITDATVRAVDIAKPSVVRIITQVDGQLTVNFSPNNSVTFPLDGAKPYQVTLSGSGAFVSSHGDILTADHVVNPPGQVLQDTAAQDVADYVNQHATGLGQVTTAQVDQALTAGELKSTPIFNDKMSEAFLSTDYTGPLNATKLSDIPPQMSARVDTIEKESAVDQKDVAIIHAAFQLNDTPSIQLDDSSGVQQQDELTIIGFPGTGDVSTKPTDLFTSSINKINVSSIKTTDNGAPVIQVGGNVEHGDSGGPALDSKGNVVGVVSFGVAAGANAAGNTSFLQVSNSARDLIQTLHLNTTPGNFQTLWSHAFNDYSSNTDGHWHKAQQEFQQLSTNYTHFNAVNPYLLYAQNKAKNEQSFATPFGTNLSNSSLGMIAIVALIIAFLALLILGAFLFVSRRKHNAILAALPVDGQRLPAESLTNRTGMTNVQLQQYMPANQNMPNPQGQQQSMPMNQRMPDPQAQQPQPQSMSQSQRVPNVQPQQSQWSQQPMPMNQSMPSPQVQQPMPTFGRPPQRPQQTQATPPMYVSQPWPASQSFQTPLPGQGPTFPITPPNHQAMRPWPCGHVNRSDARFCGICGESNPASSSSRWVEQ